ncbi:hypothetical protein U9M48_011969 [Paspalum notatum var. saurae]|uniref:Uncharacterized protein n=1 Tax=Paspalum notatum var. saurae TaxID=547442 RepID=A0AAQ3WHL0_PASNO
MRASIAPFLILSKIQRIQLSSEDFLSAVMDCLRLQIYTAHPGQVETDLSRIEDEQIAGQIDVYTTATCDPRSAGCPHSATGEPG